MKHLLLFRHAKSSWNDEGVLDFARTLAARGERDAPEMGARLRGRGIAVDLVLASPAARAKRTAALVAAPLGYAEQRIAFAPELYLASPAALLQAIGRQPDSVATLLVVGHNPGLTELANLLVAELNLDNLPTAGIVAIDCETEHWGTIGTAPRTLVFYDFPKNPAAPPTSRL
jgi:phosphohistidine phosphatase